MIVSRRSFVAWQRLRRRRAHRQTPQPSHVTAGKRRSVTHVIILDGTLSQLDTGSETNAGLTYKLLSELGAQSGLSLWYEAGLQWCDASSVRDVITGRGLNRQIQRAYGFLASRYRPGDRIFLFGFSRGAFAVRSLAGAIDRVGLLRADCATQRRVTEAYRYYRDQNGSPELNRFRDLHCHADVQIEMVGVWDTVKALGLRLPLLWRLTEETHAFHNHALGPHIKHGYQALARDETRMVYAPVLWDTTGAEGGGSRVEQRWFRGVHGDVGGHLTGFTDARPLANIPLVWMLDKARALQLPLPTDWRTRFPCDPNAPSVGVWRGWGKTFLFRAPRIVGCDPSETEHYGLDAHLGDTVGEATAPGIRPTA